MSISPPSNVPADLGSSGLPHECVAHRFGGQCVRLTCLPLLIEHPGR